MCLPRYSFAELRAAGCSASELRAARCTAASLLGDMGLSAAAVRGFAHPELGSGSGAPHSTGGRDGGSPDATDASLGVHDKSAASRTGVCGRSRTAAARGREPWAAWGQRQMQDARAINGARHRFFSPAPLTPPAPQPTPHARAGSALERLKAYLWRRPLAC